MREGFTTKLRAALEQAQDEARLLNQDFVSTEHLLLGLIRTEESEALAGLRLAGVSPDELHEKLAAALPRGDEPPVVTGHLPLSPKARRAVDTAVVRAQTTGSAVVSSRLLLISLLEESEVVSREAMRDAGMDLDHLNRILVQDGAITPED